MKRHGRTINAYCKVKGAILKSLHTYIYTKVQLYDMLEKAKRCIKTFQELDLWMKRKKYRGFLGQ